MINTLQRIFLGAALGILLVMIGNGYLQIRRLGSESFFLGAP